MPWYCMSLVVKTRVEKNVSWKKEGKKCQGDAQVRWVLDETAIVRAANEAATAAGTSVFGETGRYRSDAKVWVGPVKRLVLASATAARWS